MAMEQSRWFGLRSGLAAGVVALAGFGAGAGYVSVGAAPSAPADISTICTQIPALLAAVDFTQRRWPASASPSVPAEVVTSLEYFTRMVRADQDWCAAANVTAQPALVYGTLAWHFGNASVALAAYQSAAQGTPLPTLPTPAASGTPALPARPLVTATPTS